MTTNDNLVVASEYFDLSLNNKKSESDVIAMALSHKDPQGSRQKNGYFTVRLTVSVFPTPHPPYGQLFVIFYGVFLS